MATQPFGNMHLENAREAAIERATELAKVNEELRQRDRASHCLQCLFRDYKLKAVDGSLLTVNR